MPDILHMKEIKKSFYGNEVLHGVSINLAKGEILGLVGENGAGKSTLMNILGGIIPADSGIMEIDGIEYSPKTANDARKFGISFIHQELSVFPNLTVAENLFMGTFPQTKMGFIDRAAATAATESYIKRFEMGISPNTKVEKLSMGLRQLIEIARVLERKSKIILFDEPTTSLSQKEKEDLFRIILKLKEDGVSIVYISHILDDVFLLCDRIAVLRDGEIVGTQDKEILTQREIVSMMVGREVDKIYPSIEKEIGDVIYEATDIQRENTNEKVSLSVRSGEIIGLFGLMGAGRTEILRCLFGEDNMVSGTVRIFGENITNITPMKCVSKGIAYVTENRSEEGLILKKPVKDNLVMVKLPKLLKSFGIIDRKAESLVANEAVITFQIKVHDILNQNASSLSGGNQQKVVVSKWLANEPKLFFLDEPTRGIDVGAKYDIYVLINEIAKRGSGVLFVSSEMEELIGLCDQILVMRDTKIVAKVNREDFDKELIMRYCVEGVTA